MSVCRVYKHIEREKTKKEMSINKRFFSKSFLASINELSKRLITGTRKEIRLKLLLTGSYFQSKTIVPGLEF